MMTNRTIEFEFIHLEVIFIRLYYEKPWNRKIEIDGERERDLEGRWK